MKLLRLKQVINCTGLARSTIYKLMDEQSFPKQVSLGARGVAWVEGEVQDWIKGRMAQRGMALS